MRTTLSVKANASQTTNQRKRYKSIKKYLRLKGTDFDYDQAHPEMLSKVYRSIIDQRDDRSLPVKKIIKKWKQMIFDFIFRPTATYTVQYTPEKTIEPFIIKDVKVTDREILRFNLRGMPQRRILKYLDSLGRKAQRQQNSAMKKNTTVRTIYKVGSRQWSHLPAVPRPKSNDLGANAYFGLMRIEYASPPADLTVDGDVEPNPGPRRKNVRPKNQQNNNNKKGRRVKRPTQIANRPRQNVQKQKQIVDLEYVEAITDYNNSGGPIVSGEYRFTDIFDIDPLILSRSVQFAQYLFDIYTYAKVLSVRVHYTFDNLEQHSLDIFTFHSTLPLTSSLGSRGQLESLAATALCIGHSTMSEQYGKRSQLNINFNLNSGRVLGNPQEFRALDDFSCTSSSGPSRPLYTSWAAFSSAGTISTGFSMRANITLRVLFYNPRSIPIPIFAQEENVEDKDVNKIRLQPIRPINNYVPQGNIITRPPIKK